MIFTGFQKLVSLVFSSRDEEKDPGNEVGEIVSSM